VKIPAQVVEIHGPLRHRKLLTKGRLVHPDRPRVMARDAVRRLSQVATIVTPGTILRWHRQLIARKWTYTKGHQRIVRMAEENPALSPSSSKLEALGFKVQLTADGFFVVVEPWALRS
jgi:hypothetical protein